MPLIRKQNWTRVPSGSVEIITSKFYARHYDLVNRTEYLSQMTTDVPRFVCHNHIPVITSFMIYHYVYSKSNMTGATSRERTAIFPEYMNSPPVLCGTNRERTAIFPDYMNSPPVLCGASREWTAIFPEHMNSPLVLCVTSRERTAIFPEHMNSPPVLCATSSERTAIFPEHITHPLFCVRLVEKEMLSF